MSDIYETVKEIADICYIDQLTSSAAFHKRKEIHNLLFKFQADATAAFRQKIDNLTRKLYIAEKAIEDSKL